MKKKKSKPKVPSRTSKPTKSCRASDRPATSGYDFSKNPLIKISKAFGTPGIIRYLAMTGCIEQIQMLLKTPLQVHLGARFTVWRNQDAAKAQKLVRELIQIPGAADTPDQGTLVISFPFTGANVDTLHALYDKIEREQHRKRESPRKGGLKRGADIAASIGNKRDRIRAAAETLRSKGMRPTAIKEKLAVRFGLSERQIQRMLSEPNPFKDPDYIDPEDYELLGLVPEES